MARKKEAPAPIKVRKQHIRMTPEERRAQLLGVAFKLAKKSGILKLTRRAVITAADVSESLPNRYWPSVEDMRGDVLRMAVEQKDAKMLAVASNDGYELGLLEMPRSLQREVKRLCNA